MKMATTTASLQSFGRNLKKQYGTEGEVMAMRFFNVSIQSGRFQSPGNTTNNIAVASLLDC